MMIMDTTISISQLKRNPSKAIFLADDYPLAVKNRSEVKAYLIGKQLYESILEHIENYTDKKAVEETDFKTGRDFEELAKELNV